MPFVARMFYKNFKDINLNNFYIFKTAIIFIKKLSTLQQYIYFTLKKDSKSYFLHTKSMFFLCF